jgi:hypothetical protein
MSRIIHRRLLVLGPVVMLLTSGYTDCYKPVGRGENLPQHIRTLAIPPFQNEALRYKVEQRFTSAMMNEALRRSRSLKIVANPEGADAVLNGTIRQFSFRGALLDDFGRARVYEVTVVVGLVLRDLTRNKVLFNNQNYVFRGQYEISSDPQSYFDEQGPAVDRLARDFARSALTTILEGF